MLASKKTRRGVIGAVVLAGVLAISGYALTNVITVQTETHVGQGQLDTTAVTESAAHYTLNTTDPSKVDSVTFSLDKVVASGGKVFVQLNKSTDTLTTGAGTTGTLGQWYACTAPDGTITSFTCDATVGSTVLAAVDITQLRVVAAD